MAPGQAYFGPISMADSRYASPHRRKQVEALLASNPELQARKDAENILAIREQVAAVSCANHVQSTGSQLAQAQGHALDQEVEQHRRILDHTLSAAVANTRQILNLISDAIKQERPDMTTLSLKAVDDLQQELDKLFEATSKAQGALPYFLEKQKENATLVAGAKIQEAHQGIQQELHLKDQKIKLGQELVLIQQQAFKDVEAGANYKSKDMQDRITRLHMEQSLMRSEIETMKGQLAKAKASEKIAAKACVDFEEQVIHLTNLKEDLSLENHKVKVAMTDLEAKLKAAEVEATQHHEKELRNVSEQLKKEQQRATALDTRLAVLRQTEEASRKELEKAKLEAKRLSDNYNNQAGAYAKMTEDFKEQAKKVKTLDNEVNGLRAQKLELEKECNRVTSLKDSIHKQHNALSSELVEVKQKITTVEGEAHQLSTQLKRAKTEKDELQIENGDLRAKRKEYNMAAASLKEADAEIATLRAMLMDLQGKPTTTGISTDVAVLQEELQALHEKYTQVDANRSEWEGLARKAMAQYREMAPKYKALEAVEKQLKQALEEKHHQQATATSSGTSNDVKYWRDKYNDLLAETERE